jgi:signal transduction histidine kinase
MGLFSLHVSHDRWLPANIIKLDAVVVSEYITLMSAFWENAIVIVFFFYGLAFYSMGLALLVESGRASEMGFARSMRFLAGFGLLHGVHEWLDMFDQGMMLVLQRSFPICICWFRLTLLVTSFIALLAFGEQLLIHERNDRSPTWRLTLLATIWFAFSSVAVQVIYQLDDAAWINVTDVLARYVLGIPGSLLAFWALWRQRAIFQQQGMGRFVRHLTVAAGALALYGIVGQFITRPSFIFPASILNTELFLRVTGFPIQLFRAVMASVLAVAMISVLRALEVENDQRLQSGELARREVERLHHNELAQFNRELQAANEETARLLAEVRSSDQRRGELIHNITAAQEAERQRIARELHDETGQSLTGLALGLRGLAAQAETNPDLVQQRLPVLEAMATAALGQLRHLINDLRPPQLDDLGLIAGLRWLIERFNEQHGPEAILEIRGETRPFAPEIETSLFRIAQEGLNNVAKHARARHTSITLDFDDGPSLTVCDDGIGYDPTLVLDSHKPRTAWGLIGIQERANLIHAALILDTAPGEGTCLIIRLKDDQEV